MKRRAVSCLLSVAAVLVYASMAVAAPIPAAPTPGVLGESDLSSPHADGVTTQLNVDWVVLAPASVGAAWATIIGVDSAGAFTTVGTACPGCFLYLYQEENTNPPGASIPPGVPFGISMLALTITVAPGSAVIAGSFGDQTVADDVASELSTNPTDDLDLATPYHAAHIIAPLNPAEAGPPGEEEGPCPAFDVFGPGLDAGSFCINPADAIIPSIGFGTVNWTYTPRKPPAHETVTLWFASPLPPVYGFANTQDGAPPSPWSTGVTDPDSGITGDPVPVPGQITTDIPEPTTLMLFGSGLVALALLRRKMKR